MSVLNFKSLREMGEENLHLKVFLYGDSGAGKTHASTTAPKPCILLTEPNGRLTIHSSNPDTIVVDVMREGAERNCPPLQIVREFFKAAMDGSLKEQTGCETIVLDSLTELQRMLHDEILDQKRGSSKAEVMFTLQDWGILTDRMRKMIRAIRDLPFHIVCTALAQNETNDSTGDRYVIPSFQGKKMPNEIAGYFSIVGYVFRQEEKDDDGNRNLAHKVLLCGPSTYITKTVAPLAAVEEPDITAWLAKIQGGHAESNSSKAIAEDPKQTKRASKRRSRATTN